MIKEATTRQHVAIINCRFRADNKLCSPQQRQWGSTVTKPAIGN